MLAEARHPPTKKMLKFNNPHTLERDVQCNLAEIRNYTPPTLRETKSDSYIEFYSYDPAAGKLRRKKIKVNNIKTRTARRKYARGIIKRLSEQLAAGWNPWINATSDSDLHTFSEACLRYNRHIDKLYTDGNYRQETYAGYKSNIRIMQQYNDSRRTPITYTYQFDRKFCQEFLDHIFIERGASAQTRNNYLNFLRVFSGWMLERGYTPIRASDGITPIPKRLLAGKQHTVIPLETIQLIAQHLRANNPHFLLACHILYYCMIRPVEMTRLRIADINFQESTITVPADAAKNHQTQTVTIPRKLLQYMIELGIPNHPKSYYIFSGGLLKPGFTPTTTRILRSHWDKIKKPLHLRPEWKFYSLKDTGITEMLDRNQTSITVRDQARHSSLAITEVYTRHGRKANPELVEYEGSL